MNSTFDLDTVRHGTMYRPWLKKSMVKNRNKKVTRLLSTVSNFPPYNFRNRHYKMARKVVVGEGYNLTIQRKKHSILYMVGNHKRSLLLT